MFYIVLFIIIGYITLLNVFLKRKGKVQFSIIYLILMIMSIIRYGLGTDYFAYMWHYYSISDNITDAINSESHMDIGFRFIISIFRKFNLDFEVFIMILSFFIMLCYAYVIWKYSSNKILSVFIFFTNYYCIYVTSALRQGLGMGIFFVAYYSFINKKNTKKYIILILIASLFHSSLLFGLIIPIIYKMYIKLYKNTIFNTFICFICMFIFLTGGEKLIILLLKFIGIKTSYAPTSASILAIGVRVVLMLGVYILYLLSDKEKISEDDKFQIYTYFINICLFVAVSNIPIFSRVFDTISIIEIILIPNLISKVNIKPIDLISTIMIIGIMGILFIKDLNAATYEGEYYIKGAKNYPYITIFDKDKIFKYRPIKDTYKIYL